jgi:hypothetical protein
MLSSDSAHLLQRSRCVERFARAFGAMPLRAVEFRVDPLLYKVIFVLKEVIYYMKYGTM